MDIPVLPNYSQLPAPKRRMVELKELGYTHAQIAERIMSEFGGTTTKTTIDDLFREGTICRAALLEWREHLADQAVEEARQLARSAYGDAIATLIELCHEPHPANVRVSAAKTLAQNLLSIRELVKTNNSNGAARAITNEIENIIATTLRNPKEGGVLG